MPEADAGWLAQLDALAATSTPGVRRSSAGAAAPARWFRGWWVLFLVAICAVTWAGAATLPPKRGTSMGYAERLDWAWPAAAGAMVLLVAVALLPVPAQVRRTSTATASALVVLTFTALPVVFLGVRQVAAPDTVPTPLAWWWALMMLVGLLAAVRIHRRVRVSARAARSSQEPRHARSRTARDLVRQRPRGAAAATAAERWPGVVEEQTGITAHVRDHAATLDPYTYLVSAAWKR